MSYTQSNWRTSHDSKKIGSYYPDSDSSSMYTDNQTTFDDERFVNNNQTDSRKLQTIQRKISKQKIVAEQSNGDHMFESPHRRTLYSTSNEFDTPLQHPTGSRMLHEDNEIILSNDFNHQAFQQPNTRKVTKIISKENYSLSNSRPTQPRSASASSGLTKKHEPKRSTLTSNDIQRLKHVRRHEPAHVPSGPASKKSLITPDSWKSYPVVIKNQPAKKRATATVNQPTKIEEESKPIVEQSSIPKKPRTEKPKRDTSASKPTTTEQTPATKPPKPEKTKEEKDKIQKYILEKRQEHEKNTSDEKQLKIVQEKERKDKLKKLNEQIKKVAQQPLPPSLIKKSASSQLPPHDHSEQTRERLLHLLGPRITSELPTEYHRNTSFEQPAVHERSSSSSSSSSSESIVEIQPPKIDRTITREHSEPPIQTGIEQRHQNILRWAMNIAQDCDNIETKFKYFRPDGTQPFDIIPASQQNPQHDDGNLRSQIPILIKNQKKTDPEPIIPSKILRPSGRLSHLNQNRTSEYQGQQLPGVGNLRDPELERRVKRDRAAAKIQAVYRGYTVRKSIHWFNEKQQRLDSEYNKRPVHKPTKISSRRTDIFDAPSMNLDMRFSDDNFTIGSTLLRHYQRNGTTIIPSTTRPISVQPQSKPQQQKIQRSSTPDTYSDDYENITSTGSSTPINKKPIPEKPRVIQQPVPNTESTSSQSSSYSTTSSASSSTPTPTPKSHVPSTIQRRRSISPPLPPQMSPDNGRSVQYHPPPPATTTSRRIFDERRYSPDALERQLNAELHLLDGVEASMTQVENMERLRSVALAQQEVVSLAQVLKNKPSTDGSPQQQIRQSTTRPLSSSSSSSSSNRKRRSPSPHSRHRTTQSTSSSSESILTAREKRLRQKFHSETEFQAYEKRLKDVEKKIRLLVKRDDDIDDHKLNATEIFDDKRNVASPRVPPKSSNESSISEDLLVSNKSSSSSSAVQRKPTNDTSEILTETIQKDSDSPSTSIHQHQSDTITTNGSDIERRIRDYREQLKTKKSELDKLKQRKTKDELKRQEDELKKQLETYNQQIETLRLQPAAPIVSAPSRKSPLKKSSSSSSSGSSTPTKPQESSIAEDLPASSTTSQSKNNVIEKRVEEKHPIVKKERDFFDDDDDEEEEKKKGPELKPLETPRDERDTQQDAQSISILTDIAASSETDNDDSRRPSIDNEQPILNLAQSLPSPLKSKEDSESSSSTTTSERLPKQQIQSQSFERKSSPIANDYDEDFSEVSHSPATPTKEPPPKSNVNEIDVESIQEDIEEKQSLHDTNQSLSSKSSADEQSEILVLVKKSANTTPRRQDDKTPEEEFPPPPPPVFTPEPKIELNNNDDTSHDVSEEEEEEEQEEVEDVHEQENKVDKLTDLFLRTFIDEAIDQGKEIERLKKETSQEKNVLTHEAKEWVSEEDLTDEDDVPKQTGIEPNELEIDLSGVGEKNADERRIESPRKSVIEEPVKPLVPHTREQVIQLTDQAIKILFHQNTDFSNRSTIKCKIPNSYFTYDEQDSDNEDIRQNRRAYCQMIFDLCVELLHEMDSENIQSPQYPDWQKARLISKRYYRAKKPANRHEKEEFIQTKILEILNLNSRQTTYSKYRVSNSQRNGIEKFEIVLDEEIRRTESQWINYDDDSVQIKFNIADLILDQLIKETVTECLHVVDKRLFLSSNSTRL